MKTYYIEVIATKEKVASGRFDTIKECEIWLNKYMKKVDKKLTRSKAKIFKMGERTLIKRGANITAKWSNELVKTINL